MPSPYMIVAVGSTVAFAWIASVGPRLRERALRAAEPRWVDPEAGPRF